MKARQHYLAEPRLKDLMSDPIVAMLIGSDRLRKSDVWMVIHQARIRLASSSEEPEPL
jgi:hypothetical protein